MLKVLLLSECMENVGFKRGKLGQKRASENSVQKLVFERDIGHMTKVGISGPMRGKAGQRES